MGYNDRMLAMAAKLTREKKDDRRFCLGAIGLRSDGVLVAAINGNPKEPTPQHHAEFRLCRKLTKGSIVWVSRTLADGTISLAKPCFSCMQKLKSCGVSECYYSISRYEYGVLTLG